MEPMAPANAKAYSGEFILTSRQNELACSRRATFSAQWNCSLGQLMSKAEKSESLREYGDLPLDELWQMTSELTEFRALDGLNIKTEKVKYLWEVRVDEVL